MDIELLEPYVAFGRWCRANGYGDVADCIPERVDLRRLDAAIAEYAKPRWLIISYEHGEPGVELLGDVVVRKVTP